MRLLPAGGQRPALGGQPGRVAGRGGLRRHERLSLCQRARAGAAPAPRGVAGRPDAGRVGRGVGRDAGGGGGDRGGLRARRPQHGGQPRAGGRAPGCRPTSISTSCRAGPATPTS